MLHKTCCHALFFYELRYLETWNLKPRSLAWGKLSTSFLSFLEMLGYPGGSDGKESACNVEDLSLTPGLGRSPGEGHGNPLQCSCLENPIDRGAWRAIVHGVTKSRTRRSKQAQARPSGWMKSLKSSLIS